MSPPIPIPFHQIQAILFDLDGTLADTDDTAVARLALRLRPILGERAAAAARWLLMQIETPGNMFITFLDWLHLDGLIMDLPDRLRRHRAGHVPHFQLIPGVEEMLQTLAPHYKLGLVTTRSRRHIEQFLASVPHLAPLFQVTVGRQDTRRLKPHPSPVQWAAAILTVPLPNCLMVGDTTMDIKAARRAGAWSVGVLCGFGQRKELAKAGAHLILNSTAEIAQIVG
jgi:N-acetyl-D-muramate 6-phosphate phosphatase